MRDEGTSYVLKGILLDFKHVEKYRRSFNEHTHVLVHQAGQFCNFPRHPSFGWSDEEFYSGFGGS